MKQQTNATAAVRSPRQLVHPVPKSYDQRVFNSFVVYVAIAIEVEANHPGVGGLPSAAQHKEVLNWLCTCCTLASCDADADAEDTLHPSYVDWARRQGIRPMSRDSWVSVMWELGTHMCERDDATKRIPVRLTKRARSVLSGVPHRSRRRISGCRLRR